MKSTFNKRLGAIIVGIILAILPYSNALSEDIDANIYYPRRPPSDLGFKEASISSAPGYCASNGGSHDYEYILDATYARMTEDTLSITVEIFIANPTNCTSGNPCPEYDDSPEYINGWIDWDGDQIFESGEQVLNVDLTGYLGINYYGTMTTSTIVTVPAGAVDQTWMRVNLGWQYDPNDPCQSSWNWGDIVDRGIATISTVPQISDIIVTGTTDTNNPLTSDTSVTGVEKVKLEAVITSATGYEVTNVSWSGDVQAGDGNPYEYIADPGSHGMKYVMCTITYRNVSTNATATTSKGRNFKLFFPKKGDDDGDKELNWFEYWKKDAAVPDMGIAIYDLTSTNYGCWNCTVGKLTITQYACDQHYDNPYELTTYFGTESFGGPAVKGIDCAAEVIAHELYHKWVEDQWKSGGEFNGKDDSDDGDQCTDCDDNLPDDYETNTSHTANDDTDTYDLEHIKSSTYKEYGDQEYMAMRTGNGVRGIAIRDWANPGKQSNPSYGSSSLRDYALPLYVSSAFGDYAPVLAEFTGNFSDVGIDADEDSLYDYLQISAELNVTSGGVFHILAKLKDQVSNEITWINKEFILNVGIQLIKLDFAGLDIRKSGVNGPYIVSIFMDDQEGLKVDHRDVAHTTLTYNYEAFEQQDAAFDLSFSDAGIDLDGNGKYNTLTTEVGITVTTAGEYTIEGGLYDNQGKAVEMVSTSLYLDTGMQTIPLDFSGLSISRHRVNGPYFLKYLSISAGPQIGFIMAADTTSAQIDFIMDAHTTSAYNFADFEKADASFSGSFSDQGTNTDGDGAYNYLTVDVGIDVTVAGEYTLVGWLNDLDGQIVMADSSASMGTGSQTMQLNFDGVSIYLNGANGPYYVKYLTLYDKNGTLMDTLNDAYTTAAYSYMSFQQPLVALTGNFLDYGTDVDMDGDYEYLTVEMEAVVKESGYCVAKARLMDMNGAEFMWAEKIDQLEAGIPKMISLNFDGNVIYSHGVDGPYSLKDVYIYHTGDPFQASYVHDAYTTAEYSYCQFGNCVPIANAGPDQTVECTGSDGAQVQLDGSGSTDPDGKPLTYEWSWDSGSASGVNPDVTLPIGETAITLTVSDDQFIDTDEVVINIVDTMPPEITVSVQDDFLWPPNHKMVAIEATIDVSDVCDQMPEVELASITSSEPDNGLGDGDTGNDIQDANFGTDDRSFSLRAERSGTGGGRIYTITYRAIDSSGNASAVSSAVNVPKARDYTSDTVGDTGGTETTSNNSCTIDVPEGAVNIDTAMSITDNGSGSMEIALGDVQTILDVQLYSETTVFNEAITVRLSWPDADNNGVIDGTGYAEGKIFVTSGDMLIVKNCVNDTCACLNHCSRCTCSLSANYFEIDVGSFNEYSLSVASDSDADGIADNFDSVVDNCRNTPNPNQEDTYPPQGNRIGDACECEGNFNCSEDQDVDGSNALTFKIDFGRNTINKPCIADDICNGDFLCDGDVDGVDAFKFKSDFGRSRMMNPCPACNVELWCQY